MIIAAIIATIVAGLLTVPVSIANIMSMAAGGIFWPGWIALAALWCAPAGLWVAVWRSRKHRN
jgi:hypothetical protein